MTNKATPKARTHSSNHPPHSADRQALEQRAREAAAPIVVEEKGRWPFPVTDVASKDAAKNPNNPADQSKHGH